MIELRTGVYVSDWRPKLWVVEQRGMMVAFTKGDEVEEVPVGQLAAYLERHFYEWSGREAK